MKTAAIVTGGLAVLMFIIATNLVINGPNRPEEPENTAGYVVGTYLPAMAILIVSLILWDRSKKPPSSGST